MTTKGNPAAPKRVRVLVELAIPSRTDPREILRIARRWESTGFEIDPAYAPLPVRPPKNLQEEMKKGGLRALIVRGRIDPERISALEKQAHVRRVWPDTRLEPFGPAPGAAKPAAAKMTIAVDCSTTGDPIGNVKTLVKKLGVDKIWKAGYRGNGIVVALVDGGITAHGRPVATAEQPAIPKLPATGLVVGGWPNDWGTTALGWAQHGNMTAFDVQAVAPEAELWDIRIWEPGEIFGAYASNALAGYRAAIDNHAAYGAPHILSNSWGLYDHTKDPAYASDPNAPFARIVDEAMDEGILVLFAAGNCGGSCPFSLCGAADTGPAKSILGPNGHPRVMTVGAADLDDEWCGYTSQGPAVLPPNAAKPDFCSYTRFDGYFPSAHWTLRDFDGGTSAATAVAAGVAALLKQKRPALTQDDAKTALGSTADDIWAPGFDMNSGAGIIRAKAAFDAI